jgi:predicted CopG family antitoxin
MATKTITIMEDAYELLSRAKRPDESFSDTIRRTYSKELRRESFFGVWKNLDSEAMKTTIRKSRTAQSKRMEQVINDLS